MTVVQLKQSLSDYFHFLTLYDYVAFGWLFFLLFLFLTLALLLIRKKPTLSIFLVLLTMLMMLTLPIVLKIFLDRNVRSVEILDQNITQLSYAKKLIITGTLKNSSWIDFQKCTVYAHLVKKGNNQVKNFVNKLKPLATKSIVLTNTIPKNEQNSFKIVFENFKPLPYDYNISVEAECY